MDNVLDKARLVLERTVSRPTARETTSAGTARFDRATTFGEVEKALQRLVEARARA